jgi:Zn-dependent protease with chaperone function
MLHLLMIVSSLAGAIGLRLVWSRTATQPWQARWHAALLAFALPPLLLLSTAIALFWMGPLCHMARQLIGQVGYGWALGYGTLLLLLGLQLLADGNRSRWRLGQYPQIRLAVGPIDLDAELPQVQPQVRLVPTASAFIAQIGLWRPQIVVSQGLLDRLDHEHLAAVLCHEAAHRYYADILWFAGLGWLRRATGWLPQTSALWAELLLLRELRADRWAAKRVDPLLLAEALFTVVSAPRSMGLESMGLESINGGVSFNEALVVDRLNERVDALLQSHLPLVEPPTNWAQRLVWGVALLPLLPIVLHH